MTAQVAAVTVTVRGEEVRLLPEGVLHWPREGLLAVADFHLGKAESFGLHGAALPAAAQDGDLSRLAAIHRREGIRHLLFLGDLVHAREGLTPALVARFAEWLGEIPGDITLVIGNHDRALARHWPEAWARVSRQDEHRRAPFAFRHEPPESDSASAADFVWAGHVHPCVRLAHGPDRLRLKAFVLWKHHGLLPAFSSLAGGYDVTPSPSCRIFAIAEERVFPLGTR